MTAPAYIRFQAACPACDRECWWTQTYAGLTADCPCTPGVIGEGEAPVAPGQGGPA